MKKIFLLTILISVFWLTGCEDDTHSTSSNGINSTLNESMVSPNVNWYQIVKLNGYTTFVAELQNTCSHTIDGDFTASFYDVSNNFLYDVTELYYSALAPGQKQIVWSNGSPLTDDAKKAEIQFTSLGECYYTPVTLNKTKEQVVSGGVTIGFASQSNISEADVTVVFFYDDTVVGLSWYSFFSNTDEHTYTCSNNFNSYKIYYRAYL